MAKWRFAMLAVDKLRAWWSKKANDIILYCPLGYGTKSDAHYLSQVFDEEFVAEMKNRGYDISTMKFSIEPSVGNDKFSSQRKS